VREVIPEQPFFIPAPQASRPVGSPKSEGYSAFVKVVHFYQPKSWFTLLLAYKI
jgi:hypothetical protein